MNHEERKARVCLIFCYFLRCFCSDFLVVVLCLVLFRCAAEIGRCTRMSSISAFPQIQRARSICPLCLISPLWRVLSAFQWQNLRAERSL